MKDDSLLCIMTTQDDYIEKGLKNLGKRIRQLRKAKGFSNYEHFAFQHGFNRSSYGRFENGEDMRFSNVLKVLHALDIDIVEFFSEGFSLEEDEKTK